MSTVIKDGTGGSYGLKVDKNNHAHTVSTTIPVALDTAIDEDAYNINTGLISVTGDATLLYLKNNEDKDLVIEGIALGSFEGITHSDDPYITLKRNPTGGDLISDGTAVSMNQNRNFGSSNTLAADAFKGKVGGTISGGDDIAILQATPGGRSFYTINFVLQKGTSLAIDLTANRSSGTANWYCALVCYLVDTEIFN
jgi:hypothetical protein